MRCVAVPRAHVDAAGSRANAGRPCSKLKLRRATAGDNRSCEYRVTDARMGFIIPADCGLPCGEAVIGCGTYSPHPSVVSCGLIPPIVIEYGITVGSDVYLAIVAAAAARALCRHIDIVVKGQEVRRIREQLPADRRTAIRVIDGVVIHIQGLANV